MKLGTIRELTPNGRVIDCSTPVECIGCHLRIQPVERRKTARMVPVWVSTESTSDARGIDGRALYVTKVEARLVCSNSLTFATA